jgi:hypothetical protein
VQLFEIGQQNGWHGAGPDVPAQHDRRGPVRVTQTADDQRRLGEVVVECLLGRSDHTGHTQGGCSEQAGAGVFDRDATGRRDVENGGLQVRHEIGVQSRPGGGPVARERDLPVSLHSRPDEPLYTRPGRATL